MSLGNKFTLEILDLSNEDNQLLYSNILDKTQLSNAYYTLEHLSSSLVEKSTIWCFLFKRDEEVVVIYPIIKREVVFDGGNTYSDISSGYGYSGPLYNEEKVCTKVLMKFWEGIDAWYKENNIVSEFLRFNLEGNFNNYSGTVVKTLKNVKGKLCSTFEEQWDSFKPKVRNNYRKGASFDLDFNLYVNDEITNEHINSFYNIYLKTMQRRNADAAYYFSKEYFLQLINKNKKYYAIAFVSSGNHVISTELVILDGGSLFAYLGGTDANFFNMRPNDFLRVEVIKWAIKKQFEHYVLGGGLKDDDGLYKSKKAYFPNSDDVTFCTGRKVVNKELYKKLCLKVDPEYNSEIVELDDNQYFPFYRK